MPVDDAAMDKVVEQCALSLERCIARERELLTKVNQAWTAYRKAESRSFFEKHRKAYIDESNIRIVRLAAAIKEAEKARPGSPALMDAGNIMAGYRDLLIKGSQAYSGERLKISPLIDLCSKTLEGLKEDIDANRQSISTGDRVISLLIGVGNAIIGLLNFVFRVVLPFFINVDGMMMDVIHSGWQATKNRFNNASENFEKAVRGTMAESSFEKLQCEIAFLKENLNSDIDSNQRSSNKVPAWGWGSVERFFDQREPSVTDDSNDNQNTPRLSS